MTIGYRPKGESGPLYNPERDYAYITPTLMCSAIARLENLSEEARAFMVEHAITTEELTKAAEALARAQRDFVNAADPVSSFEHALARRDFMDIRYPVRQLLFSTIGEVFCAAWFTAVREVTKVNEDSPAARGMADFIAAVQVFAGNGSPVEPLRETNAHLQLRNDVLQARLNTLYAKLQEAEAKLAAAQPTATVNTNRAWCAWWPGWGNK